MAMSRRAGEFLSQPKTAYEAISLLVINEFQAHAVGIVSAAGKTVILLQSNVPSVMTPVMRFLRHRQNSILHPFRAVLPGYEAVVSGRERGPIASVSVLTTATDHCLLSLNLSGNTPLETNPGANRDFPILKTRRQIFWADVSNLKHTLRADLSRVGSRQRNQERDACQVERTFIRSG